MKHSDSAWPAAKQMNAHFTIRSVSDGTRMGVGPHAN